jgi:aerobic carbon-monoxide dehydrogenase medium subunit
VIPAEIEYLRPGSVDEALAALADPEARAIAGGHSLLPMMKLRLARPTLLVDLAGLDLGGIGGDASQLVIGALTTYDELVRLDGEVPAALREAAASVGDAQVRNAGTIGGAVAHGDPASDVAAALLALDAVVRLRSVDGSRDVPVREFFLGPFETALAEQELIEAIVIPRQADGEGSAYVSIEDQASGYPLAGAAARVRGSELSVGLTGVGGRPLLLADDSSTEAAIQELELAVADDDVEYRRNLITVVVRRAIDTARSRAEIGG